MFCIKVLLMCSFNFYLPYKWFNCELQKLPHKSLKLKNERVEFICLRLLRRVWASSGFALLKKLFSTMNSLPLMFSLMSLVIYLLISWFTTKTKNRCPKGSLRYTSCVVFLMDLSKQISEWYIPRFSESSSHTFWIYSLFRGIWVINIWD